MAWVGGSPFPTPSSLAFLLTSHWVVLPYPRLGGACLERCLAMFSSPSFLWSFGFLPQNPTLSHLPFPSSWTPFFVHELDAYFKSELPEREVLMHGKVRRTPVSVLVPPPSIAIAPLVMVPQRLISFRKLFR